MKKTIFMIVLAVIFFACGNNDNTKDPNDTTNTESVEETSTTSTEPSTAEATTEGNPSYDPHRGEGKFSDVKIDASLDQAMAKKGENVYNTKCASCHKLTDEKLVGPGWKGVTTRRKPEWIMNFSTNPDPMIDKDPELQAQLEICLVRMPDQNISDEDARDVVEFMRKIDGVK